MLRVALGLFIVALIAAIFGYGGLAAGAADFAKLFFFGFLVLAAITLVVGLVRGRGPGV